MLAKPEYSSPPDEVCCWPGRRGGEPIGNQLLAGVPWRRANRESVAGRGADADGWGLPGRDATIDTEGVAVKEWQ